MRLAPTLVFSLALGALAAHPTSAADAPHAGHAAPTGSAQQPAILFDNLGTYHHEITTSSPQAQAYFDQGLRLVYAFNHDEAIRSFNEATRLDPNCAMAWWGIAFALGPNYNLPLDDERNQKAFAAMQKAVELAAKASPREQDYIAAVQKRYSLSPKADRKQLDRDFADAMRKLAKKHPNDLDAATLFAESMMDLRPWDLWTPDGKPQPGTEEIVKTLEAVLAKNPAHPGANHYYIHAVEASPDPRRALPSAQRIGALVPGAGHLVHMPSHIYMRVGRYADATETNRKAIEVDRVYLEKSNAEGVYPMMYVPHNVHFMVAAASMEGRSADALVQARSMVELLDADGMRAMPMLEYFYPTYLFAMARFGHWDDVLAQPAPPADLVYSHALWSYARGLAFARKGRLDDANMELVALAAAAKAMPADRIVGDNTPARDLLGVAQHTLAGEIAAINGNTDAAVRELNEAIALQDKLPYTEPPPWYYPVRQSLGQVLLDANHPKEAAAVFTADLERNPDNGWSLWGLGQSLNAMGQKTESYQVNRRFIAAWERADAPLNAARF